MPNWSLRVNIKPTAFPPNVSLAFVYGGGARSTADDPPHPPLYKSPNSS